MLIDFIPAKSKVLYQRVSDSILTFTSNNNLSFRLPKEERKNIYLDSMTGGEDVYLCIKLLKKGEKYLVDNNLKIFHKPRKDMQSLLKQFYNYGIYSVEALSNLNLSLFELFYNLKVECDEFKFLTKKKFPLKGLVYASFFFLHQLALLLYVLTPSQVSFNIFIISLIFIILKEISLFFNQGLVNGIKLFVANYLVNWAFSIGALVQSFKSGVVFIPPQLRKSKSTINAKYRVFNSTRIEKEMLKEIYESIDHRKEEDEKFKYISDNIIRIIRDNKTIILKRTNFIIPFYRVIDYYEQ